MKLHERSRYMYIHQIEHGFFSLNKDIRKSSLYSSDENRYIERSVK